MAAARPQQQQKARHVAGPDVDETESLQAAALTLKSLCPGAANPQAIATAVISTWIIERMKRHTTGRISDMVVFDLGDAHLTGMIDASLSKIGDALAKAGFPFDKAFNDLTKPQAVALFVAGAVAHREAAVIAGEAPSFPFSEPFNDPIPFDAQKTQEAPPWE